MTGQCFREFEDNIMMLTPYTTELVNEWLDSYPEEWIVEAIHEAVNNNVRRPNYINAILQRWEVEGKGDLVNKDQLRQGDRARRKYADWED